MRFEASTPVENAIGPVAIMQPAIEWNRYSRGNISLTSGKDFYAPRVRYPQVGDQMMVLSTGAGLYAGFSITRINRSA